MSPIINSLFIFLLLEIYARNLEQQFLRIQSNHKIEYKTQVACNPSHSSIFWHKMWL